MPESKKSWGAVHAVGRLRTKKTKGESMKGDMSYGFVLKSATAARGGQFIFIGTMLEIGL
jgi:hypothetical protein